MLQRQCCQNQTDAAPATPDRLHAANGTSEVEAIMQTYEGGCLCSAIRYRIAGSPISSALCHCATCRRASGAPLVAWLTVNRHQLQLLSGLPEVYRSSQGVKRQFCGSCGSQLSYEMVNRPETIDISTVSLDDPNLFPPTMEVWLDHKLPWHPARADLAPYGEGTGHSDEVAERNS